MGEERSKPAIAVEGEGRRGPNRLRFLQPTNVPPEDTDVAVVEVEVATVASSTPGVGLSDGGEILRERY